MSCSRLFAMRSASSVGFTMEIAGSRFYPIMVAEKRSAGRARGCEDPPAMRRCRSGAGRWAPSAHCFGPWTAIGCRSCHTRRARHIEAIAADVPRPTALALRALPTPRLTDVALAAGGEQLAAFDPTLDNTASATIVSGGGEDQRHPRRGDGRTPPPAAPGSPSGRVCRAARPSPAWTSSSGHRAYPVDAKPDLGLFQTLAGIRSASSTAGKPIPLLLLGVTDGRFFSSLGDPDLRVPADAASGGHGVYGLIDAQDERLPVASLEFGTRAIGRVLERFA